MGSWRKASTKVEAYNAIRGGIQKEDSRYDSQTRVPHPIDSPPLYAQQHPPQHLGENSSYFLQSPFTSTAFPSPEQNGSHSPMQMQTSSPPQTSHDANQNQSFGYQTPPIRSSLDSYATRQSPAQTSPGSYTGYQSPAPSSPNFYAGYQSPAQSSPDPIAGYQTPAPSSVDSHAGPQQSFYTDTAQGPGGGTHSFWNAIPGASCDNNPLENTAYSYTLQRSTTLAETQYDPPPACVPRSYTLPVGGFEFDPNPSWHDCRANWNA
ncbi:hypothetical protein BU26DRAFT_547544 [Trematosphaeria pertusa]|uniref:Uncharacterized protein n=1 Tax=Trematosphaeria pertusa TaxID=390896 RepID=A0A6A6IRH1_9PLEO|nr:uncharacterized protein BU26DRAFT_547544 [Trematosphaeria pertusa]KAF2252909.1 hypothetical protein BU26DRAFT_547544 [Trematosphaeria pertusa]